MSMLGKNAAGQGGPLTLTWKFSSSTSIADPGAGNFRYGNATPANIHELVVSDTSVGGHSARDLLSNLNVYNRIIVEQQGQPTRTLTFRNDTVPGAYVGYVVLPVTYVSGTQLPVPGEPCILSIQYIGYATDLDAVHRNSTNEFDSTRGIAEKVTPAATDRILIESQADAGDKRYVQVGNMPAPTPPLRSMQWYYSGAVGANVPSTYVRFNNLTIASATALYISDNAANSNSVLNIVGQLKRGTWVLVEKAADPTSYVVALITNEVTAETSSSTFPISVTASAGTLAHNDLLSLTFFEMTPWANPLTSDEGDVVIIDADGNHTYGGIANAQIRNTAAIAVSKLAAGTEGQVLKVVSGVPSWATGGSLTAPVDVTDDYKIAVAVAGDLTYSKGTSMQVLTTDFPGAEVLWTKLNSDHFMSEPDLTASKLATATGVVAVGAAAAPTVGQVLRATSATAATWQDPPGGADANAVHVNASGEIAAVTEKVTPVAADLLLIEDSAATNAKKRVQLGNLPGGASLTNTAPVAVTKATAAVGTATDAARQDHKHDVTTAAAGSLAVGGSSSEGTATSLARSDHNHGLPVFGTGTGTFCEGSDIRLSNARTPTAHATSHAPGGGDAMAVDAVAATGSLRTLGTSATSACAGSDARLSDDRTASGLRSATTVVAVSTATAPTAGQVLTATSSSAATWQTASGSADANAVHVNASGEIAAVALKATPVSGDLLLIEDSADTNAKKRVTIGSLPSSSTSTSGVGAYLITDTFSATGGQTTFTLSQAPSAGKAMMSVNGLLQKQADYSITGVTATYSGVALLAGDAVELWYVASSNSGGISATTVAAWRLNENGTPYANVGSGAAINMSNRNTPTNPIGSSLGSVIDMDAHTDGVYSADTTLGQLSVFTAHMWVKRSSNQNYGAILLKNSELGTTWGAYPCFAIEFQNSTGGAWEVVFRRSGPTLQVVTASSVLVDKWTHVCVVVNSLDVVVYQDGVQVGTATLLGAIDWANNGGWWAGVNANDLGFIGQMKEIRIESTAWTAAAIRNYVKGYYSVPPDAEGESVTSPVPGTTENNYAPTGWSAATIVRLNPSGVSSITGFSASTTAVRKTLINVSANNITLAHQDAGSSAANRIIAVAGGLVLEPDDVADLWYDSTTARWRVV